MSDAEHLENYLQALRRDPHTLPPPDLDPQLAELARRLAQQVPVPTAAARRRMWERALAQSHLLSNGHLHEDIQHMTAIPARPRPTRTQTRVSWTLLAAACAAALALSVLALLPPGGPTPLLSSQDIAQQSTITPIPVASSTPLPGTMLLPAAIDDGLYTSIIVFSQTEALRQAATQNASPVQRVELVYRITLEDGSVLYIPAVPPQIDMTFSYDDATIATFFPNAAVLGSVVVEVSGSPARAYTFDNGYVVYIDSVTGQLLYLLNLNMAAAPLMGAEFTVLTITPTPIVPFTSTMTATVSMEAQATAIIVTATAP
ncbi:MAG: hypothetical protein HXY40_17785 [Chloroflexi bacterium]|nr:hypothetical protein [Chloroflexota bacterium]